jgi:hypothetical protein
VITSSGEIITDGNLQIYPNPVRDILTINSDSEIKTLRIADLYGRPLIKLNENSKYCELDLSQLHKGFYFLILETADKTITRKVIRE